MSSTKLHVPNAFDAHFQDVLLTFGITGSVLTGLLLLVIAYAAWNPISRHHLNRVSFRLLVCALISNLLFVTTAIPVFSGPSAGCSFVAFFGASNLMFSACMFFCIALNLQLVLVHHVNGNLMERFYYIGSITAVAILNIVPYAAGQFGYFNGSCWFSNPRPDVQFRWLLGSQSVWILLMSTGEVGSFFVILGYMYRMRSLRVWSNSSMLSLGAIPKPPIVLYRSIILRIGLYPLLSCCLNFTGSILNIWRFKNPVPTELQWRLSSVAADPSFLRAMRVLRNHSKSTHSTGRGTYINSHRMKRFSMNSRARVHVQLEQEKNSMTSGVGGNQSCVEQSSAALKPFEEQSVVSHGGSGGTRGKPRGKPSFMKQEPEQSGLSQAERDPEGEEELHVEAQTRSKAEDIARQI